VLPLTNHILDKITALLDTHVDDVDARKALADDLIDLLSHYKPKETQTQLDIKAQAQSEFETCLFLRSVSKAKYGSLLTTLQIQYSLGKEQYPDTIHKAVDVLSQYRWDQNPFLLSIGESAEPGVPKIPSDGIALQRLCQLLLNMIFILHLPGRDSELYPWLGPYESPISRFSQLVGSLLWIYDSLQDAGYDTAWTNLPPVARRLRIPSMTYSQSGMT